MTSVCPPAVLFGAFDRHNFGDLLFPHLMTASLPGQAFEFAGLVARDLRAFGGHRVKALDTGRPLRLVHVGGELLTCTAWQAAVMLLDPAEVDAVVARYDADPAAAAWAAQRLGTSRPAPYVVGRDAWPADGKLIFNAVGGVDWAHLPAAHRDAVKAALARADWVSVRDRVTQAALRAEGLDFPLCPDPAVMVADFFGGTVAKREGQGAVGAVQDAFPQGYLAIQFSADFGDSVTLDALARELARLAAATGLGLACYRAGAAPWHDDMALYETLRERLPPGAMRLFPSLDIWDICALIAASRGAIGSSLHGRIVALAFNLPRVSLLAPQQGMRPDKASAFAETWEPEALPRSVPVEDIQQAAMQALAVPDRVLRDNAAQMRDAYRQSQHRWNGLLACKPGGPDSLA